MLEGTGFEILERLPCCWLLFTALKQFAAEWIIAWRSSHLLPFPLIQLALPWAAGGTRARLKNQKKKTLLKCSPPWPVRPCPLPTTGENWLCPSPSTASASVPAFTLKIDSLLFKSEEEEERVFPKTPGMKRGWAGFSYSFLLAI